MPFTAPQQREYRALVESAWQRHCRDHGTNPKNAAAKDLWTREHLHQATGRWSTKDCDAGRHHEFACAHFEELSGNGINYQLRAMSGDARRIRHTLKGIHPPFLQQFADEKAFVDWLKGIARQSLNLPDPPDLHLLTDDQIANVNRFACIHANRVKSAAGG